MSTLIDDWPALCRALVERRKQLEIPSRDLDIIIECADGLVSKWECGLKRPSALMLMRWIDALHLNIELDYCVFDKYQVKATLSGHDEPDNKRYPTPEFIAFLKQHDARLVAQKIS